MCFTATTESRVIGIIDAHHHIWRQADLPWLVGPMQPRHLRPYEPIRRDYPVREYLDDLAGNGVVKSVYVQTNWAKERTRTRRPGCNAPPRKPGWPHAIVAYADFGVEDVRRSSTGSSATRWCVAYVCSCTGTRTRSIASPRALISARIRRFVATSRASPTTAGAFELQVFAPQMPDAANLAKPVRRSRSCCSTPECWRTCPLPVARPGAPAWYGCGVSETSSASFSGLARSSIAMTPRTSPVSFRRRWRSSADRCLFGSNFPIEKLWTGYGDLIDAYLDTVKTNPRHRDAILRDTAMRVYSSRALALRQGKQTKGTGGKHGVGNQDS